MTKNMSNPYRMDANGRPHGLRRHDIKPITFFLYYLNFQSLFLLYDILPIFVTFPFLKTLFLKLKNTFLKTNRLFWGALLRNKAISFMLFPSRKNNYRLFCFRIPVLPLVSEHRQTKHVIAVYSFF